MARLRIAILASILSLLLFGTVSAAAQYEAEVDIIVQSGEPVYVIPPCSIDSGSDEGMQYINGDGKRLGGMEGFCDGELVRLYAEIRAGHTVGLKAKVILHTSPEKMVRWNNVGWKGKKLIVRETKSQKAKDKEPEIEWWL